MEPALAPARLLIPILAFALPLGLWLQFGDANSLRTVAMIAGCALVAWASARLLAGSDRAMAVARRTRHADRPAPAAPPSRDVGCDPAQTAHGRRPAQRRA